MSSEAASNTMMDDKTKQHYLADSPPTVVRLEIKSHFDTLKDGKLRKYAHYLSRFVYPGLSIISPTSYLQRHLLTSSLVA
jgi:dipeptidyl-peptidase-3